MPSAQGIAVIGIAMLAFFLYTRPRLRMEFVSLLLLLALVLLFHFFPLQTPGVTFDDKSILSGFGHPVLITICSLMILGRGLLLTGALEPVVRLLSRLWRWSAALGLLVTLLFAMVASAFINDTPVLVLMLPMLLGLAERTGTSPAQTLMPVNFAILGGGMLTPLGTSTNLLVLSIAVELGMRPMGLFDFTLIAATALAVALPYLWLIAPRLLPRLAANAPAPARRYRARLPVTESSALQGRTLAQAGRSLGRALPLTGVRRNEADVPLSEDLTFEAGDDLLLADTPPGLTEIAATFRAELYDQQGPGRFVADHATGGERRLVEIIIGADSALNHRTLREVRFAEQFGVVVVALHRSDEDLLRTAHDVSSVRLQSGDLLLVQGGAEQVAKLRDQPGLMMLDSSVTMPRTPLAPWAIAIMASVIAIAAFRVLPIHVAALLGVAAMLWRGCVRFDGVGRALSFEVILLIVSSLALGQSLVASGAADWLAGGIAVVVALLPPALQVASFMALAAVLTNFVSNSAAAAIGTPIAMAMAQQLGAPVEPFVLAILFGANLSYATPMAYQTNLLIMQAAGYSFRDFVRVGTPLVLLMLTVLSVVLARHYQL